MKKLLFIIAASCLLVTACNRFEKNDPNAFEINTITVEDSVRFPAESLEEWVFDDQAYYLSVIDVPVSSNENLRDNIIAWISGFLSDNYDGDSQDVKAMVEFDRDEFLDPVNGSPQSRLQHFITLEEDNARYVTYLCDNYLYTGGIHGASFTAGATFSKKTGERFSYRMFKNPFVLCQMVREAVELQYFASLLDGTDRAFEESIFSEAAEDFPLPNTDPWIKNDSVFFVYEAYEIAPYSYGMPECGLPYLMLRDNLTDEGKLFFQEKNQ